METWKSIEGYDGKYQISTYGRIRNNKRELKPYLSSGYLMINLYRNSIRRSFYVHRLVAMTFLDNPMNFQQVNHIDEDKTNNKSENLEWCDAGYNNNYGTRNDRIAKKLINCKYTSKEIRQYDINGNFVSLWQSSREIQRVLGYDQSNICKCCNGKIKTAFGFVWKH